MFAGLSTLRKDDKEKNAELDEKKKAMQAYLSKYTGECGSKGLPRRRA